MPDLTDEQIQFRLREFEALRSELDKRNEESSKIQTGVLVGAVAVTAWLLHNAGQGNFMWWFPAAILVTGAFALVVIGRHQNRLGSYISQNIEKHFPIPLFDNNGRKLAPRDWTMLDNLSDKGRNPSQLSKEEKEKAELTGGWENWFEEQTYNYTWLQIGGGIAATIASVIVGAAGFWGVFVGESHDLPRATGYLVSARYEVEKDKFDDIVTFGPIASDQASSGVKSSQWTGTLYDDFLVVESEDKGETCIIPTSRLVHVQFATTKVVRTTSSKANPARHNRRRRSHRAYEE